MATSAATKRKHVINEFSEFDLPNLALGQQIARIVRSPGSYLFEVETPADIRKQKRLQALQISSNSGSGDQPVSQNDAISESLDKNLKIEDHIVNSTFASTVGNKSRFQHHRRKNKGKGDAYEPKKPQRADGSVHKLPLASMPTKFRNTIYLIRGNFIYVEPIEENAKVSYEIVKILNKDHIKQLYLEKAWPEEFIEAVDVKLLPTRNTSTGVYVKNSDTQSESESGDESEEIVNDYFGNDYLAGGNPNAKAKWYVEESESDDESYEESGSESSESSENESEDVEIEGKSEAITA